MILSISMGFSNACLNGHLILAWFWFQDKNKRKYDVKIYLVKELQSQKSLFRNYKLSCFFVRKSFAKSPDKILNAFFTTFSLPISEVPFWQPSWLRSLFVLQFVFRPSPVFEDPDRKLTTRTRLKYLLPNRPMSPEIWS